MIKKETKAAAHIKREKTARDDDDVTVVESRPRKRARVDADIIVID